MLTINSVFILKKVLSIGHLLVPAQLPGPAQWWSEWSNAYHWQFQTSAVKTPLFSEYTSTYSALQLTHCVRFINSRVTYLLTVFESKNMNSDSDYCLIVSLSCCIVSFNIHQFCGLFIKR